MAKPLCGRFRAPDPRPVEPTARRQRQPSSTTAIRIDETSSRRRIGRTHPTHACLPVHKGFQSLPMAYAPWAGRKRPVDSGHYANAVGVLKGGGVL